MLKVRISKTAPDAPTPDSREAILRGILHDLNNVFSSLSIAAHLLEENPSPERRQTLVASLAQATRRGQRLLDEMERHGDRETDESIEFDLQILLEAVARSVRRRLGETRRLSTSYDSELPRVFGHPGEIFDLFYSMLLRAASMTPDEGEISISCRHAASDSESGAPSTPVGIELEHTAHPASALEADVASVLARIPLPAGAELSLLAPNRWTIHLPSETG